MGNQNWETKQGVEIGNEDRVPRQGTKTGNQDGKQRQGTKNKNGEQRIRKDKNGEKREKSLSGFYLCFSVKKVFRTTKRVYQISEPFPSTVHPVLKTDANK